jgi:hypothetical protein
MEAKMSINLFYTIDIERFMDRYECRYRLVALTWDTETRKVVARDGFEGNYASWWDASKAREQAYEAWRVYEDFDAPDQG